MKGRMCLKGIEFVEEVEQHQPAGPHVQQGTVVSRSLQALKGAQQQLWSCERRATHPALGLGIRLPWQVYSFQDRALLSPVLHHLVRESTDQHRGEIWCICETLTRKFLGVLKLRLQLSVHLWLANNHDSICRGMSSKLHQNISPQKRLLKVPSWSCTSDCVSHMLLALASCKINGSKAGEGAPDFDREKPPIFSVRGWSACLSSKMHSSCRFLQPQHLL